MSVVTIEKLRALVGGRTLEHLGGRDRSGADMVIRSGGVGHLWWRPDPAPRRDGQRRSLHGDEPVQ